MSSQRDGIKSTIEEMYPNENLAVIFKIAIDSYSDFVKKEGTDAFPRAYIFCMNGDVLEYSIDFWPNTEEAQKETFVDLAKTVVQEGEQPYLCVFAAMSYATEYKDDSSEKNEAIMAAACSMDARRSVAVRQTNQKLDVVEFEDPKVIINFGEEEDGNATGSCLFNLSHFWLTFMDLYIKKMVSQGVSIPSAQSKDYNPFE